MKTALVVLAMVCTGGPLIGDTADRMLSPTPAPSAIPSFEVKQEPFVHVPARLLDAPVQPPLPADRARPAAELPKAGLYRSEARSSRDYPPSPWETYQRGTYRGTPVYAIPLSAPGMPRW